jgi:membrane fusion protein, copper/silver efflux system
MKKHYIEYLLAAIFTVVVGAVAGWYFSNRDSGDVMQAMTDAEAMDIYQSGPYRIGILVNPETPEVGKNRLSLSLKDQQGNPVSGADIKAYGEMAAMGSMQAMRAPADLEETSPGMYEGLFNLQMSGAWPLTVNIEKSDMGSRRLNFEMATGRSGLQIASGGTAISPMGNNDESTLSGHSIPQQDASGIITTGNYRVLIMTEPESPQIGNNTLKLDVADKDGNPVADARVRAVIQKQTDKGMADMKNMTSSEGDMKSMADSMNIEKQTMIGKLHEFQIDMKQVVPGSHKGQFELPSGGQWTLAVDIQKEGLGHGDLVFDMLTDNSGLQLATTTPEGIAFYTCSMHNSVRAAEPGQCPICSMDLVPVTKEEVTTGSITVDNRRRQLIGLETGIAKSRHLISEIRAVGEVMYDETRLSDVSLHFDGWIGELKADYVGKKVRRGEMLFSVYGPELLAAQQEYLQLLKRRSSKISSFIKAAEKRLLLWDMTPGQIKQLQERAQPLDYVPIMAPRSGTVVEKKVVEGSAHKAGMTLLRIADLDRVWIEADVYESELNLIKVGMKAVVTLPYIPNQRYLATVDYIYPYLMGNTRTGRIRISIGNKDGALKPEMYAEVMLKTDLGERLSVPEEAVLFAGDSRVVFIDMGEGKLKPKTIKTGVRNRDYIEVVEGLSPGDRIVTSGNFLIAAESRIKSGVSQW